MKNLYDIIALGEGFTTEFIIETMQREERPALLGIKSIPRNPLLFGMLYRMDAVEQVGSGVRRIREICRDFGVAAPDYEISDHWVTITFKRPELINGVRVEDEGAGKIGGTTQETTQGKILILIRQTPTLTRKVLAAEVGLTEDGIKYHLDKLRKTGILRHVGPTKSDHWEVLK